jgi:hypothetical protein
MVDASEIGRRTLKGARLPPRGLYPRPPFAVCAVLTARHTAPPPQGAPFKSKAQPLTRLLRAFGRMGFAHQEPGGYASGRAAPAHEDS